MSKETQKTTGKVSEFKIVRKFLSLLNITDEGKSESFVRKVITFCKDNIEKAENNITTLNMQFKIAIRDMEDNVRDKEEALELAYATIDLEAIGTNASQKEYIHVYLRNIEDAEAKLELAKEVLKTATTSHNDKIDSFKETIKKLNERLEKVSAN